MFSGWWPNEICLPLLSTSGVNALQLTVWRFLDGNRAHEKQSVALVAGLRECLAEWSEGSTGLECFDIACPESAPARLFFNPAELKRLPRPDFLIGAGRRSRLPMLMARRRYGGRAVAINLPQLPYRWFDFVLVPEHDRPPPLPNVIQSRGALTEPLPQGMVQPGRGLILLGGPSRHFDWDGESMREQLRQLLEAPLQWQLSDSRRTPAGTLEGIGDGGGGDVKLIHWRDCPPGWLREQMASAEQIWVSEDSISMLFEALQSRARVGVLRVPGRRPANKVRAAVQRLLDEGLVSERLQDAAEAQKPEREPLNQYLICARALLKRAGFQPLSPRFS